MTEEQLNATQILLKLTEKKSLVRECVQVVLKRFIQSKELLTKEEAAEYWAGYNAGRLLLGTDLQFKTFEEAWAFLVENKAISIRAVN